jgi:hypothetical protein
MVQDDSTQRRAPRWLVAAVTVVGAVATLALGRGIWPDRPGAGPPSDLIPVFAIISAIESVGFGLGLSFLLFGLPQVRRYRDERGLAVFTYLSVVWLLVSWWPHDNLHRVLQHSDYAGLLRIEYGFHATLIAAATIVAVFVLRTLARRPAESQETVGVH